MKKWIPLAVITLIATSYVHGNPIAHYTFDDSNDRYKDSSGNNYHGTLDGSGTTFASSGVTGLGDAMDSSTASRVITATLPGDLSEFTISFWATSSTGWDNWISLNNDALFLQNAPYATPAIFLDNPGGVTGYNGWDLATNLGTGLNHIAISADSTAGIASLYYNGSLADTAPWTVSSSETIGALTIGGAQNTTARNIDAIIDDVQVYSSALQAADISSLYTTPGSVVPEPSTITLMTIIGLTGIIIRRQLVI